MQVLLYRVAFDYVLIITLTLQIKAFSLPMQHKSSPTHTKSPTNHHTVYTITKSLLNSWDHLTVLTQCHLHTSCDRSQLLPFRAGLSDAIKHDITMQIRSDIASTTGKNYIGKENFFIFIISRFILLASHFFIKIVVKLFGQKMFT